MRGGYMELNLASTCDVLVLGSGIAGISAALTAAESGASVILVCKGRLFSGSSFYPGTWGLGLVGPADEADEADLISTIEDVGWQLFHLMLEVASGRKTWAEHWKLANALVLFNPAPVT